MVCWLAVFLPTAQRVVCTQQSRAPFSHTHSDSWELQHHPRYSTLISGDKHHTQSPHSHSWPIPGKIYPWKVPVLTPGFSRCSIKVVNRISSLEHKGILRFSSEQIQKSHGNKHPVKITISPRTMQVKGQASLMGLLSVLYKGGFGSSSLERSYMKAIIYLSRLLSATESLAAAGWGGETLPGLSYLAVITLPAKVSESLSWVPGKVWIYSPMSRSATFI